MTPIVWCLTAAYIAAVAPAVAASHMHCCGTSRAAHAAVMTATAPDHGMCATDCPPRP
jgi:hypothetical protein